MAIRFSKEPKLERPDLVCGWPGIGRIGIMAVDYLRRTIAAEELGERRLGNRQVYPNARSRAQPE